MSIYFFKILVYPREINTTNYLFPFYDIIVPSFKACGREGVFYLSLWLFHRLCSYFIFETDGCKIFIIYWVNYIDCSHWWEETGALTSFDPSHQFNFYNSLTPWLPSCQQNQFSCRNFIVSVYRVIKLSVKYNSVFKWR